MAISYGFDTRGNYYWSYDTDNKEFHNYQGNAAGLRKYIAEHGGIPNTNGYQQDDNNKLTTEEFLKQLGVDIGDGNGDGNGGGGGDPNAWAKQQAAEAKAEKQATGRLTRDSALASIEGATRDRDFAIDQEEKNRAATEALLRRAQEQAEQDFKVQTHVNAEDWRGGENSALGAASDIATSGASQLSNKGVESGSMLNALNNLAISEFGKDQSKVNLDYGKKQSSADRDINLSRKKTQLDTAKAWDDMMQKQNDIRNQFANQVRSLYGTAAAGELDAGGNPQQYLDMQKGVQGALDFERKAPTIDTTYTAKPISSFYKTTNVGVSNANRDNRIYGTTSPTSSTAKANTTPATQEALAPAKASANASQGGANES
jgi:hypothetical protein